MPKLFKPFVLSLRSVIAGSDSLLIRHENALALVFFFFRKSYNFGLKFLIVQLHSRTYKQYNKLKYVKRFKFTREVLSTPPPSPGGGNVLWAPRGGGGVFYA